MYCNKLQISKVFLKLHNAVPSLIRCRNLSVNSSPKEDVTHFGFETVKKSEKSKKGK